MILCEGQEMNGVPMERSPKTAGHKQRISADLAKRELNQQNQAKIEEGVLQDQADRIRYKVSHSQPNLNMCFADCWSVTVITRELAGVGGIMSNFSMYVVISKRRLYYLYAILYMGY
ncbi:hypothetical protein GUJ93_ZPchr0002g26474 [Zizania palustris]|uniref:Uncharacterized protein n=1 Tax=Zizania palustris TaxID=103762 RepID=A0A8J5RVC2_ZIZPA|nr:hypothetical protein GUJ93_ZPchr0002g26474 [Zizania palustris]